MNVNPQHLNSEKSDCMKNTFNTYRKSDLTPKWVKTNLAMTCCM